MISAKQYQIAASLLKCEIPVIKAVAGVESNGSGFLSDGRIKILFEPHIFYRELKKENISFSAFAIKHPKIAYLKQGTYPYGTYADQYERLKIARSLDWEIASKSCSWGKFQPLGLYHKECGFDTISEMIKRFEMNEYEHLMGFVRMIKFRKLDIYLQKRDWTEFAKAYNGSGYKGKLGISDDYDFKIRTLYKKLVA